MKKVIILFYLLFSHYFGIEYISMMSKLTGEVDRDFLFHDYSMGFISWPARVAVTVFVGTPILFLNPEN